MKIKKLTLNNFMAFENAEINWSDNINIICGENSTGKTTLLKVMYSLIKPLSSGGKDNLTKEMEEQVFVKKIQGDLGRITHPIIVFEAYDLGRIEQMPGAGTGNNIVLIGQLVSI